MPEQIPTLIEIDSLGHLESGVDKPPLSPLEEIRATIDEITYDVSYGLGKITTGLFQAQKYFHQDTKQLSTELQNSSKETQDYFIWRQLLWAKNIETIDQDGKSSFNPPSLSSILPAWSRAEDSGIVIRIEDYNREVIRFCNRLYELIFGLGCAGNTVKMNVKHLSAIRWLAVVEYNISIKRDGGFGAVRIGYGFYNLGHGTKKTTDYIVKTIAHFRTAENMLAFIEDCLGDAMMHTEINLEYKVFPYLHLLDESVFVMTD